MFPEACQKGVKEMNHTACEANQVAYLKTADQNLISAFVASQVCLAVATDPRYDMAFLAIHEMCPWRRKLLERRNLPETLKLPAF